VLKGTNGAVLRSGGEAGASSQACEAGVLKC
jgi:hypothetical protein